MKTIFPGWTAWPLACLVGAAVGAAAGWLLVQQALFQSQGAGAPELLWSIILMPSLGLGMGAAQALVLRGTGARVRWWALATMLGWLLGLSVDFTAQRFFPANQWLSFAWIGFYQGALQWLVLRKTFRRASLWIAACLAGWLLAAGLIWLAAPLVEQAAIALGYGASRLVLTWSLAGLGFGILSIPVLRWIMAGRAGGTCLPGPI